MSELPRKLVMNQKQTDIGYLDNMGLFVPIHTLELASEAIRRWNSHEALLKACKFYADKQNYTVLVTGLTDGGAKAKAAIAQVKE